MSMNPYIIKHMITPKSSDATPQPPPPTLDQPCSILRTLCNQSKSEACDKIFHLCAFSEKYDSDSTHS